MTAMRVLILEDSLIIAMEAEEILRDIGAEVVDIFASAARAAEAVEKAQYDCAMLDVNLGEAMSFEFARQLQSKGIAFGFVTGYSDTQDFPTDLQDVPLLVKPFNEHDMRGFLGRILPREIVSSL
jgi:CheY-like chemotaxis protein